MLSFLSHRGQCTHLAPSVSLKVGKFLDRLQLRKSKKLKYFREKFDFIERELEDVC